MSRDSVGASSEDECTRSRRVESAASRLVYEHNLGAVELHSETLKCLNDEHYLKDTIVQFYSAYLLNEICDKQVASRVHIFDSIFSGQLDKIFDDNKVNNSKLDLLGKWYNNIDIFEKHFLIFPVCSDHHWFAIIVCYPLNVRPIHWNGDEHSKNNNSTAKREGTPGIIVMDSLGLRNPLVTMKVRDFLDYEWRTKLKEIKRFSHHDLKEYFPSLPKQKNAYDCGIYMLNYIRCFLEEPDRFYRRIRRRDSESSQILRARIREVLGSNNREHLKALIYKVCKRYN